MYNSELQNNIKLYSEELQSNLDPRSDSHQKLVQKGLILFRQQHIYGVKFSAEKVEAKVRDVTPVQVELYFEQTSEDRCTCPETGICRHQIAVFFSVLSRMQSAFQWLLEWKQRWNVSDVLSTMQRGSELLKQTPAVPENGPEQWLRRINDAYQHISAENSYQLEDAARISYRRLLGFAPVEREWKPLFRLFAAVESLKIINSLWADWPRKRSESQRPLSSFTQYVLEEAEEALGYLSVTAAPFAFDEYLHYIRENSAAFLEVETDFPTEFTELYMMIWSSLFKFRAERSKELNRLQSLENSEGRVTVAIIHLAILLEEDELALAKINQLGTDASPYLLDWLKLLQSGKSKARLVHFLPTLLQKMTTFISSLGRSYEQAQFTRAFFQVFDHESASKLDPTLLDKMYITLLPHSRYQYEEYLLTTQDFKKWAELQAFSKNSIEYIDRHTIDFVAKHDPEALRPLYHDAITYLINNRNRDSYRRAVRFLKRLQKLYKREKKQPQWELYLAELLSRTKRLRAFQEECRKGKLIHDES